MPEPAFKRVEELFNRAVALPPGERPAYLDAACAGDADLRAAVTAMLRHDAEDTDIFRASPLAREAAWARQYAPTLPAADARGAASPSTPLPRVPGYEVLRELGRGGMGVVYLARHTPLNRLVALKMLPATPATPEQLARFRLEAEALARLQHPNVVPIYDIGEFEGHPYFTLEYVAGPDLARLLDGRPQDVAASARLVEVLARAVHAVHQCGIIHRDLKPANVLFSRDPEGSASDALPSGSRLNDLIPKITDFGLAKDRTSARLLTQSGDFMGTPCYMAPEQVRGTRHEVGPAADVYGLGSILYELLTGRPPFDAATPVETIAQLLHQEPLSPSRLRPRLPADVVTICLKCLEKSPRRRYVSAWDLAEDLRRFRAGEPIRARPVGPVGHAYRWVLRRPLVAGLLALSATLAVALVVALLVFDARLSAAVRDERQQIVQLNVTIGVKEREDGDSFAAVLRFAEALSLEEGDAARQREHRVRIGAALRHGPTLVRMRVLNGRVVCTNLGPSGGQVATLDADGTVAVWDVQTGRRVGTPLRLDEVPGDAALSDEGQFLATVGAGGVVRVWDVSTAKSRELPWRGTEAVLHVAWAAGGRALLTQHDDFAVRPWDLTAEGLVARSSPWGEAAAYSALGDDARRLFIVDRDGVGQVWDVATGSAAGPPLRPRQAVTLAAISPDGERVATAGPRPGLRVWQVRTGEVIDLAWRDKGAAARARFSPDGRLLVVGNGNGARAWDARTGQPVTPPLRHGGPLAGAAFDAEGKQLVTVGRGGTICVWELPRASEAGEDASPEEGPADERPVAEILALARVLACARINEKQQREALDEEALRAAWAALHQER